ncbi:MAG: hypothetical protein KKA81_08555, partial [Bacteroidetes bacterium]|nr:hypothetical protein [Bacteroidota bacterium]
MKSQISLENTYNVSAGVAWLELSGTKYYVMDVANSQCRIYNLDHSLWKTMSFSLPANNYLYDIQYVTQNIFDQDSEVECLVTYYEYIDNGSTQYYEYTTVVYNEDLQVLL